MTLRICQNVHTDMVPSEKTLLMKLAQVLLLKLALLLLLWWFFVHGQRTSVDDQSTAVHFQLKPASGATP
ncbi:hypothetical protein GALL_476840 [mine drainage metagenome]|uniref:Uncharacterized protein n=1 Tax=mine drainage metagenome TaxID=410659 RepID=A0A1J5PGY6_9ZZZZ